MPVEPSGLTRSAIANFKEAGSRWAAELPSAVERLAALWAITVGDGYGMASCSFTAPAVGSDGRRVVLKVRLPHREAEREPDALRMWAGDGAVELLAYDDESGAMLLEACDPGTPLAAAADVDVASVGGSLLRRLHRPVPDVHPFELLADVTAEWAVVSRERVRMTTGPRSDDDVALVDMGAELLESLPREDVPSVLVHGDYHHWNILAAQRASWLVIDPKPMVGDPMFDTAQFMGNRFVTTGRDAFAGELARFCDAAGFDEDRALLWCFARETDNMMWAASVDDPGPVDPSGAYARFLKSLIDARRIG